MADTAIERAIFDHWYDGMAAKEYANARTSAWVAWQRRAVIAEQRNAELLRALVDLYSVQFSVADKDYWAVTNAADAIANHSNEVTA